jgi:hypothetical protein
LYLQNKPRKGQKICFSLVIQMFFSTSNTYQRSSTFEIKNHYKYIAIFILGRSFFKINRKNKLKVFSSTFRWKQKTYFGHSKFNFFYLVKAKVPYPSPFKNEHSFNVISYKVLIPCSLDQESWYRYFLLSGVCREELGKPAMLKRTFYRKAICTYRLGTAVIGGIFIQNESSFSCCIVHCHLIPAIIRKVGSRAHWLV